MEQMSKPADSVHVECTRTNEYSLPRKGNSVIQFRNPEHSVMTLCIRGNETVRICCQLPGQTMDLVVVVKFIVSGSKPK